MEKGASALRLFLIFALLVLIFTLKRAVINQDLGHSVNQTKIKLRHKKLVKISPESDTITTTEGFNHKELTNHQNSQNDQHEPTTTKKLTTTQTTSIKPPSTWPNMKFTKPIKPTTRIKTGGLAVMVLSSRTNKNSRENIRKTWAKGHQNNVFFMVGESCPIIPKQRKWNRCEVNPKNEPPNPLQLEMYTVAQHDLTEQLKNESMVVVLPMHDVYQGLPRKVKEGYAWILENTDADFILKADDDMYVRVDSFRNFVNSEFLNKTAKENGELQTEYHYGGWIRSLKVWTRGKNPEFDYKHSYYPPFAIGSYGHVVSRPLAQYVVDNKEQLFEYGGEDTSLGIWVKESVMNEEHKVKYHKDVKVMTNGKNCMVNKYHVIGHSLTDFQIKTCYDHADEIEDFPENE